MFFENVIYTLSLGLITPEMFHQGFDWYMANVSPVLDLLATGSTA